MPRVVSDGTVYCNIAAITTEWIELDCGHGVPIVADLPEWLRRSLGDLRVGDGAICVECIEQEIEAGRAAREG